MKISIVFHILGLVFLFAGLLFGTRLVKLADGEVVSSPLQMLSKKIVFGYIIPGAALIVLSGLHQFFAGGAGVYMKQGWMHTKLTLVAVLLWSGVMVSINLMTMAKGGTCNPKAGSMHHGIVALCLVVILVLTLVKPF